MSEKGRKPGWRNIPEGGLIIQAGNSVEVETGSWRSMRPLHDAEKCINCMRCFMLCPDSAIIVQDGKVTGMDYDHCKGCGICAAECPPKVRAIQMRPESEFRSK